MKKFELWETAEYRVMTDTAEVDLEFCRWPTAPDGYIPNSIIRSWRKKRKRVSGEDFWEEFFFDNLYDIDKGELSEEEEITADKVFYSYFNIDDITIPAEMERKKSVRARKASRRKSSRMGGRKVIGRKGSAKPKISQKRKESENELGSLAFQQLPDTQPKRSLTTSRRSLVSQRSGRRRSDRRSKAGIEEVRPPTSQEDLQDRTGLGEGVQLGLGEGVQLGLGEGVQLGLGEGVQLGVGEDAQHPLQSDSMFDSASQQFDTVPEEGQQSSVDYADADISQQGDIREPFIAYS
ncbi:uncharacterized protein LOC106964374 [Poecilia latipinna]|uniref:uncharacterized protein LOC106964374 n=1 Tax=Poecilia latipinna TaxID=48699 RepID=UPI00072E2E6F|nr:PREDICTED: uncharacterized protein LOC106964374 [Poecilia latipinna]